MKKSMIKKMNHKMPYSRSYRRRAASRKRRYGTYQRKKARYSRSSRMHRTGGYGTIRSMRSRGRNVKCAKYLDWVTGTASAGVAHATVGAGGPILFKQDVASTTALQNFCAPAREAGVNGREMDCIKMKSIYFTGTLSSNAVSTTEIYARVMFIQDRQANGAVITYSDVYQTAAALATGTGGLSDRLKMENRYRFKTLYDKVYKLSINSNTGFSSEGRPSAYVKVFIKFKKPLELQFDHSETDVGTAAALRSNNVNMFATSVNAFNHDIAACVLTGKVRIRFADGE